RRIAAETADPPSKHAPALSPTFDAVLARALARNVDDRFPTARAFGAALEETAKSASLLATHAEVAAWLDGLAGNEIAERRDAVSAVLTENGALRDAPHAKENQLKSETVVVDFTVAMPAHAPPPRRSRTWIGAGAALVVVVAAAVTTWLHSGKTTAPPSPVVIANSAENAPVSAPTTSALPRTEEPVTAPSASPAVVAASAPVHRPSHPKPTSTQIHAPPNPYSKPPN
ncbi:MAG TPA: hypothetical protein VF407_06730, partial [Polyangiaceae bacterium]